MWERYTHPQLGNWPTTQAGALTGNQPGNLSVCRLVLNPLSHSSQGKKYIVFIAVSTSLASKKRHV